MKLYNRCLFSVNFILENLLKNFAILLLLIVFFVFVEIGFFSYFVPNANIRQTKKQIGVDTSKYGIIVVDTIDIFKSYQFQVAIKELDNILSIGSFSYSGSFDSTLEELRAIQNLSTIKDKTNFDTNHLYNCSLDNKSLLYAIPNMIEEELKDIETYNSEDIILLYLGNNFSSIPIGTKWISNFENGEYYATYVVAGRFNKKKYFYQEDIFGKNWSWNINMAMPFDDMVAMVYQDSTPITNEWIYTINDQTDIYAAEQEIMRLAEEYGATVICKRLENVFEENNYDAIQISRYLFRFLSVMSITILFMMIFLQVTHFICKKSEYGIMYASGFSYKDIRAIIFIENSIKTLPALLLSGVISKWIYDGLYLAADTSIQNYLFARTAIGTIVVAILLIIISSMIPAYIIKQSTPVELIGGNDT